jgi:hypothetical protein
VLGLSTLLVQHCCTLLISQWYVNRHERAILVARSFSKLHVPSDLLDFCPSKYASRHAEARSGHLSVGPYILVCLETASSMGLPFGSVFGDVCRCHIIGDLGLA